MSDDEETIHDGKVKVTRVEEGNMTRIILDPGRNVLCDDCLGDWTDRPESGGILFGSKAICPECAPSWISEATHFGELSHIRARCPEGTSFADWVRDVLREV